MNKKRRLMLFALCALICTAPLVSVTHCAAEERRIIATVSVEGTIIAEDGREYAIADDDMRETLMDYVGSRVLVVGDVTKVNGQWIIDIISVELLDDEDPENLERT